MSVATPFSSNTFVSSQGNLAGLTRLFIVKWLVLFSISPSLDYILFMLLILLHNFCINHVSLICKLPKKYFVMFLGCNHMTSLLCDPSLTAYSDADWVECPDTRRSTLSFYISLGVILSLGL